MTIVGHMSNINALALLDLLANDLTLPDSLDVLRTTYKTAKPFPHVVIDNLFSAEMLEKLAQESPAMGPGQWINVEQDGLEQTIRMRSAVDLGSAGSQFVSLLHSAAFLFLLSEITSVWQLLPDPYLQGGGHALMRRGGYFKVHSDRSVAYDTGLTRRLAMIVFLNKDWKSEHGGQLELWNDAATACEASVEPAFNRTIIFEIAHPNFHGVPTPLTCPEDQVRKSFLVYYHTVGINGNQAVKPHTSIFAPGFYKRKKNTMHLFAEQVMPPILVQMVRRWRNRSRL